jgi:hypothetical protein
MPGKILYQDQSPVTQTIDSGKALAQFLGLGEDLPQVINLANGARLSLSSKKDCYYFTNSRGCSCKAGQFGRDCKHKKALLGEASSSPAPYLGASRREEARISVAQSRAQAQAYQARQRQLQAQARRISSPMTEEEPLLQKVPFKPFLEA